MVIDASVLLAVFLKESHGPWGLDRIKQYRDVLRMSTVNLAEVLIVLEIKQPEFFEQLKDRILSSTIRFIPPSVEQARIAAQARHRFPLNLGDCFAYALAKEEDCPILTTDPDFRKTDVPVVMP
ncbi:MAG: type II toxin-antitoxin system VapC family toxin [Deltaproteobacteria bacterium]|nr:type II toxin-antitoxin system VapC family toxin [Deltaproteobacteria bacterium]